MPVLALGVSYRRAPVELLERLAFGEEEYTKAYRRMADLDSITESVVLSTCNRVEVYAEVSSYHSGFLDLKRFLAESKDVPPEEFAEPLYSHYEDDAAQHLLSVAAGLDSMVLGEPQILTQVRGAFRRAEAEGAAGPVQVPLRPRREGRQDRSDPPRRPARGHRARRRHPGRRRNPAGLRGVLSQDMKRVVREQRTGSRGTTMIAEAGKRERAVVRVRVEYAAPLVSPGYDWVDSEEEMRVHWWQHFEELERSRS